MTTTSALRTLYFARSGWALLWAALMTALGSSLSVVVAVLLVLYPLVDVAAAVVDLRSSRSRVLLVNIATSALAAIGLAVAGASGVAAVLRVWGAWAAVAGIVQLVVALRRRRLGGQWAMILSGGISVFAGTGFVAMAAQPSPSLQPLAGYALLGGIFFLVSALRLGRPARVAAAR
jgi:uncharacterized membrane protein HdeD (DUF308 family)